MYTDLWVSQYAWFIGPIIMQNSIFFPQSITQAFPILQLSF